MESLISQMSSNRSSISQASLPETMMCCLDEYCIYPFGSACESCALILKDRGEKKRQRSTTENESNISIAGLHYPEPGLENVEQLSFGGPSNSTENKEDLVIQDGHDAALDSGYHDPDSKSIETIIPYSASPLTQASGYPYTDTTFTTQNSQTSGAETSISKSLEPWLSTLIDHTLAGHGSGNAFVGGAEEQDLTEDDCPLCFGPIGDPRDQHLLRCKYAHEEREREERMTWLLARGRELRGKR